MPPLRPAPCIQTALKNHVYYSDRAKMWAAKTVELTEAGEYQKAKAAQRKCSYWLARAMRLEQR